MSESPVVTTDRRDGWTWWEARRLRYNLGLAFAGWVAYAAACLIALALGDPLPDLRQAASTTLMLGTWYLVVMAAANVAYLAGVLVETIIRPRYLDRFRVRAWNLGFWGSVALPFVFPMVLFAVMFSLGPAD